MPLKPPHPRAHGAWYLVAASPPCAEGSLGKPGLGVYFSALGPLATGMKDLSYRHCVSRLESRTRKQPLLTLFVYEIKGPWKGGKRVQVQEVRLPGTW